MKRQKFIYEFYIDGKIMSGKITGLTAARRFFAQLTKPLQDSVELKTYKELNCKGAGEVSAFLDELHAKAEAAQKERELISQKETATEE